MEAIEFAVRFDDGVAQGLHDADVVLVGVSRTSKTPLSIYLGYLGWKATNVPLVKGIEPPKELFEISPGKIVGLTIDARSKVDTGTWFGALPVAPGALAIEVADEVPEGPLSFDVVAPGSQSVAYVEVDDDEGRLYAGALPLAGEGMAPRAHVTTTPLTPGRYWIVVSGEPKGAIGMTGATMALPVRVGPSSACPGSDDAGFVAWGFPRWTAVDGRVGALARASMRHEQGLGLALGSLLIGAVLETLLILIGARRAREDLAHLAEAAESPALRPSRKIGVLDVAVVILFLFLALGLLATFVTWRFQ